VASIFRADYAASLIIQTRIYNYIVYAPHLKSEVPGEAAMVFSAASEAQRQPSWLVAPSMCSSAGSTSP